MPNEKRWNGRKKRKRNSSYSSFLPRAKNVKPLRIYCGYPKAYNYKTKIQIVNTRLMKADLWATLNVSFWRK